MFKPDRENCLCPSNEPLPAGPIQAFCRRADVHDGGKEACLSGIRFASFHLREMQTANTGMKSTTIVKPNLKLLLFGALLIAVIHNLILPGHSEGMVVRVSAREPVGSPVWQRELDQLLVASRQHPSPEIYMRISHCYEKQRNLRQAVRYLRLAQKLEPLIDDE
jgi:hypothetical protein